MKAAQINKYGGIDFLEVNENVPKPTPSANQVLVEVKAASINPIDWKIREGYLKEMAPLQFPVTLGGDFAGVVSEISEGVFEFKIGDEVFGSAIVLNGGSGAFAEYLCANTRNIALKPETMDFIEASALPLVGTSTVQALEEHIKLQSGQKILIHGGAGGIGHIAIQLAKTLGAFVATTVNTNDIDFVKQLGADEVIDYKTQNFEEILNNFDAVFDTVGGQTTNKSFMVLRKEGILVSMLGQPKEELSQKYAVSAIGQNTQTNTTRLTRLSKLVDGGKIKVNIDKIFPLDSVREAFTYQEKVRPRGKVVLEIKE